MYFVYSRICDISISSYHHFLIYLDTNLRYQQLSRAATEDTCETLKSDKSSSFFQNATNNLNQFQCHRSSTAINKLFFEKSICILFD